MVEGAVRFFYEETDALCSEVVGEGFEKGGAEDGVAEGGVGDDEDFGLGVEGLLALRQIPGADDAELVGSVMCRLPSKIEPWEIHLVDGGGAQLNKSMTAERTSCAWMSPMLASVGFW